MREDEKELYRLCEIEAQGEGDFFDANFQLVLTFLQMPHVDLKAEMEKRKGAPLTAVEERHLAQRVQAARYWLDHFAREEDKIYLQDKLPARAEELGAAPRGFLRLLADALKTEAWEDDALQARIFDVARRTPISQSEAFKAVYRVLLDRDMGPRAGALMAVLERDFVVNRLAELAYDEAEFLKATAIPQEEHAALFEKEAAKVTSASVALRAPDIGDLTVTHDDGKTYVHRVRGEQVKEHLAQVAERVKQKPQA